MQKKIKALCLKDIAAAIKKCDSKRSVISYLKCNPRDGNNFHALNAIIEEHNLNVAHFGRQFKYNKIPEVIKSCYSLVDVAKSVGLVNLDVKKISSRLCRNIKECIKENGLDTSHFSYSSKNGYGVTRSDEEVFAKNSVVSQSTVKKRFISLMEYRCSKCNISSWNGERISLQLDHMDGDSRNNLLENLRLLCPNCHSQTENFGSKNKSFRVGQKAKDKKHVLVKKLDVSNKWNCDIDLISNRIKNSSIDFSKHGWVRLAADIIGVRHQHVCKWMRKHMGGFYQEKCFKRSPVVKLTEEQKKANKEERKKIKAKDVLEIKSLVNAGFSHRDVAKQYGVHHSSVQRVVRKI